MRLTALFILIAFQSFAQNSHRFADTSALWNITETYWDHFPAPAKTTNEYRVIGDMTIGNNKYQNINCGGYNVFVRQDSSKKVYSLLYPNQEKLLFDFNLSVGDTFVSNIFPVYRPLTVDSVDYVNWGGLKKRMFLSCKSSSCQNSQEQIWVEGVGRLNHTNLYPFYSEVWYSGPSVELACYWQNDTLHFTNPNIPSCDFDTVYSVSVSEKEFTSIKIYPNPASDYLLIETDNYQEKSIDISICSLDGKELFHSTFINNKKIPVQQLPAGVYLLSLKNTNGESSFRKLLIAR